MSVKFWTDDKLQWIRDNISLSNKEIGSHFDKPVDEVKRIKSLHKISKKSKIVLGEDERYFKVTDCEGYFITENGVVFNAEKMNKMAVTMNTYGYPCVIIKNKRVQKTVLIHRELAMHLLERPKDFDKVKYDARHIDGDRLNYSIDNIEWINKHKHASNHSIGVSRNLKSSEEDIISICEQLESGVTQKKISKQFGIGITTIQSIKSGKTWKHISKNYNF